MNWADGLIVFIIIVSGLISMKRGFIKEALSLVVWAVALLVASWSKEPVADLFIDWFDAVSMRQLSAFILVFIAVLVLGGMVNYLLGTLIDMVGLKSTDRFFGVFFGLARGVLIVLVAILYLPKLLPVDRDLWWRDSVLIPHFAAMEEQFFTLVSTVYDALIGLL